MIHFNTPIKSKTAVSVISLAGLLCVNPAMAARREFGSHVHGEGRLNIAVDAKSVFVEFTSPAANIVGFEQAPSNAEQEQQIETAVALLRNGEALFHFEQSAACFLVSVEASRSSAESGHKKSGEKRADKHEQAHKDDRGNEHDKDRKEGLEPESGENHSEFQAMYEFQCDQSEALATLELRIFDTFPALESVHIQLITESSQQGGSLDKSDPRIEF